MVVTVPLPPLPHFSQIGQEPRSANQITPDSPWLWSSECGIACRAESDPDLSERHMNTSDKKVEHRTGEVGAWTFARSSKIA